MADPVLFLSFSIGVWPIAAAGAAAISIPVIIHLITRLQRRPMPWAAMQFVMQAYRKQKRRLQLEHLILLLVRCALPILLGLALAGVTVTGGWAALTGAGSSERGRAVILVLDRSLTTASTLGGGATRFSEIQQDARAIIQSLDPDDRVAVIDAATPARRLIEQPTTDHSAALRAIEALEPSYGHAALQQAVDLSVDALSDLPRGDAMAAAQKFVVVLSDWSRSAMESNEQLADAAKQLNGQAMLVVREPTAMAENIQITRFEPRRLVQLQRGGLQGVGVTASLRRIAGDTAPGQSEVVARLVGPSGAELATTRQTHTWVAGQTEAQVAMEFSLAAESIGSGGEADGVTLLGLDVALTDNAQGDTVANDNRRYSLVELRRRVTVGVADQAIVRSSALDDTDAGWSAGRWVRAALSPSVVGNSGLDPAAVQPSAMTGETMEPWQVAVITRPDLLSRPTWTALGNWARAGGLLWVVAPQADVPATWAQELRRATDAPWLVGLEPIVFSAGDEAATEITPGVASGWSLATDQAPPEALSLLGAEWTRLLAPIRVTQRLPLSLNAAASAAGSASSPAPEPGSEGQPVRMHQAQAWLSLSSGEPILAGVPVGNGYALVQTVAIDTQWSNLPTKPLFVPLLHETVRGVLGASPAAARRLAADVGDPATLGESWAGASRLAPTDLAAQGASSISLQADQNARDLPSEEQAAAEISMVTAEAVRYPGIYQPVGMASGERLAVNVDAAAGDTSASTRAQVAARLAGAGKVRWLDRGDVTQAVAVEARVADLTGLLLWALLFFLLIEVVLARLFSHASTPGQWGALGHRLWVWLHGGQSASASQGGSA